MVHEIFKGRYIKALIMDYNSGTQFLYNTFEFICMCKVCKEHLKIMSAVYQFSTLLICLHAIQLSLKFTSDCLIFLSSNKYQWNKRWTNCSWRWKFAVNLRSIESSRTKHHLDQREAWEPRKYSCGARRKGADYNKHRQDWCRKLYLYSIQWLW